MLLDLKVLLNLGCWGVDEVDTFYWKWTADVFIIPGFLCFILFIVYTCGWCSRLCTRRELSRNRSASDVDIEAELARVSDKTAGFIGWTYAGIFFMLPRMTATVFKAFKCRSLAPEGDACESWLEAEYSVSCCTGAYDLLWIGGVVGATMILALPLGFGWILWRASRKNWKSFVRAQGRVHGQGEEGNGSRSPSPSPEPRGGGGLSRTAAASRSEWRAPRSAESFPVGVGTGGQQDSGGGFGEPESDGGLLALFDDMWLFSDKTQYYSYNFRQLQGRIVILSRSILCAAISLTPESITISAHFSFFIYCYTPSAYYWEICEMLHRITMSGFLMFAPGGRGSVDQLFCGLLVSFGMTCLHVKRWPYAAAADNWLRFAAEIQIFQTIAVALALKSRGSSHSAMDALGLGSAEGYDWLLVISFWVLTPAMLLAVLAVKFRQFRKERSETNQELEAAWRTATMESPLVVSAQ